MEPYCENRTVLAVIIFFLVTAHQQMIVCAEIGANNNHDGIDELRLHFNRADNNEDDELVTAAKNANTKAEEVVARDASLASSSLLRRQSRQAAAAIYAPTPRQFFQKQPRQIMTRDAFDSLLMRFGGPRPRSIFFDRPNTALDDLKEALRHRYTLYVRR